MGRKRDKDVASDRLEQEVLVLRSKLSTQEEEFRLQQSTLLSELNKVSYYAIVKGGGGTDSISPKKYLRVASLMVTLVLLSKGEFFCLKKAVTGSEGVNLFENVSWRRWRWRKVSVVR